MYLFVPMWIVKHFLSRSAAVMGIFQYPQMSYNAEKTTKSPTLSINSSILFRRYFSATLASFNRR